MTAHPGMEVGTRASAANRSRPGRRTAADRAVIDTAADLMGPIDDIERRLAAGERP